MAKLTRQQSKLHAQACALLEKDSLSYDEKIFVLENWHEGARHNQADASALFTPLQYAHTFAIEGRDAGSSTSAPVLERSRMPFADVNPDSHISRAVNLLLRMTQL